MKKKTLVLISCLILPIALMGGYFCYLLFQKHMYIWLPNYVRWELNQWPTKPECAPKHIMFFLCDHHEYTNLQDEIVFLKRWEQLSAKHMDRDGKHPQYTFFYPFERFNLDQAKVIVETCARGFGDLELHWHMKNETSESWRAKLVDAKEKFFKVGALRTLDNKAAFGFIHGNWGLDNSLPEGFRNRSEVNNELDILREEGCYADFTFPAFGIPAQPEIVNSIYYALDDPREPKSYNTGVPLEAGKPIVDNRLFMIFQGLITIRPFVNGKLLYIDRSAIQDSELPSPKRVDNWIENGVHIKGKDCWVFIKLHMHGAYHPNAVLGKDMDEMFSYLEKRYNDGSKYFLHYVTAREAYNIAKAAEAGLTGNPNRYRDYFNQELQILASKTGSRLLK